MPDHTIVVKSICECHNEIASINWKDLLQLISPIVVVVLFGLERFINYKANKKESERTWYYKVLIDPNLSNIDKFFNMVKDNYVNSCMVLSASQSEPHSTYNSLKSKEIGKFQKIKRTFEIDVVSPIIFRYSVVGEGLTNTLMDLEDLFSSCLDNNKFEEIDIDSFSSKLSGIKSIWLNILYEPIK